MKRIVITASVLCVFGAVLFSLFLLHDDFQDRTLYILSRVIPFERMRLDSQLHRRMRAEYTKESQSIAYAEYLLLGDSHSEFFDHQDLLPEYNIVNRGIQGDTTLGVLERLEEHVLSMKTGVIYLLIGANDLKFRSNDMIIENYKKILELLDQRKVVIQSLFPFAENRSFFNKRVKEINARLAVLAAEMGYEFIDLYPLFVNETETGYRPELTRDGSHLTPAGYAIWAEVLRSHMETGSVDTPGD